MTMPSLLLMKVLLNECQDTANPRSGVGRAGRALDKARSTPHIRWGRVRMAMESTIAAIARVYNVVRPGGACYDAGGSANRLRWQSAIWPFVRIEFHNSQG